MNKSNENELTPEYILTLLNEFKNSNQEGSISIVIKGIKPMIVSNTLIYDYIKKNIDVGNYKTSMKSLNISF